MAPPQALTGYYRYTDIWFDWPTKLDSEDGAAVKAILAHDAMVHPEHPLRPDGVQGAQLYIGTLNTGETRLLFTSAQVDYVRYWLHAMGMTKEPVPLPYSDCLLTMANLKNVAPAVYSNGGALRKAIKDVEKINKRLRGSNPELVARRDAFERVRKLWTAETGVWCAVDFEAWERDHKLLTEFGWSTVGWKAGQRFEESGHLIVEEGKPYTNGTYTKGYVYGVRERYDFGQSETVKRAAFKNKIHALLSNLRQYGLVFLVFHNSSQDIKYFESLETPIKGFCYADALGDPAPSEGIVVVDTAELLSALMGVTGGNRRSLKDMCGLLGQKPQNLHNAGNDAHLTLSCFMEMANGGQIDNQRENRWPNQTANGSLWVQVKSGQAGSDDDDEDDDDCDLPRPKLGYDPVTGELYRADDDEDL
ncbi:hypothetical protein FA15DRAFT_670625 [Coprinopsis marcescibilis]|uniref:Gfd2/YDR514C-like C-terminal domain-containing protein n=1 Tax=Coprinopsis marcescibilis TaxID=230819 RepID=A0A5C3KRJ3_COPMA|nr:hypothetical protein FA15DRAFT_670625 [Coprinopsis marcescibilis]